jgi:lipopolysaccharide transport system permease protein
MSSLAGISLQAGRERARQAPVLRISRSTGSAALGIRELWEYRELFWFLTLRDLKVRYKQTLLGAAWAVIQPLFTMLVFSLFFGRLAKVPSDNLHYPIFSFAALVPWTFFANGLTLSSNSLVGSANLITKVYFPRLIVPAAAVVSGLVDLLIAMLVLVGMMVFYGVGVQATVLWIVPLTLLAVVSSLGVGLWLSALNVEYRDVRHAVPFIAQFWMFITPVAYPSSLLSEPWRTLYGLNPMAGVVEGFRWALLGANTAPGPMVAISGLAALLILVGGAFYFKRMEKSFADVV